MRQTPRANAERRSGCGPETGKDVAVQARAPAATADGAVSAAKPPDDLAQRPSSERTLGQPGVLPYDELGPLGNSCVISQV